jgi:hypothetical protein
VPLVVGARLVGAPHGEVLEQGCCVLSCHLPSLQEGFKRAQQQRLPEPTRPGEQGDLGVLLERADERLGLVDVGGPRLAQLEEVRDAYRRTEGHARSCAGVTRCGGRGKVGGCRGGRWESSSLKPACRPATAARHPRRRGRPAHHQGGADAGVAGRAPRGGGEPRGAVARGVGVPAGAGLPAAAGRDGHLPPAGEDRARSPAAASPVHRHRGGVPLRAADGAISTGYEGNGYAGDAYSGEASIIVSTTAPLALPPLVERGDALRPSGRPLSRAES